MLCKFWLRIYLFANRTCTRVTWATDYQCASWLIPIYQTSIRYQDSVYFPTNKEFHNIGPLGYRCIPRRHNCCRSLLAATSRTCRRTSSAYSGVQLSSSNWEMYILSALYYIPKIYPWWNGRRPDLKKIRAITETPRPTEITTLRSLLSLIG